MRINKNKFDNHYFWTGPVFVWLLMLVAYWQIILNRQVYPSIFYFYTSIDMLIPVLMVYVLSLLYRKENKLRFALGCFIAANILMLLANTQFDYIFYHELHDGFTDLQRYFYRLTNIFSLLFAASFWAILQFQSGKQDTSRFTLFLPYLIVFTLVALLLNAATHWQVIAFGADEQFQQFTFKHNAKLIQNVLRINYLLLLCFALTRAIKPWSKMLVIGNMILISPSFFIYQPKIQHLIHYFGTTDLVIMLGGLLILVGLYRAYLTGSQLQDGFSTLSAMRTQISVWLFVINLTILIVLFYMIKYMSIYRGLSQGLPIDTTIMLLVVFSLLSISLGSLIVSIAQRYFDRISYLIDGISDRNFNMREQEYRSSIDELYALEQFIYRAIKAIQDKVKQEREYSQKTTAFAHDIRSPLTVIESIANNHIATKDQNRLLISSAQQVHQIADELLCYHRNKLSSNASKQRLSISQEIQRIVQEKQENTQRNIVVIDNCSKPVIVEMSALDFERSLLNLLQNALDATTASSKVDVIMQDDGDQVVIQVKDSGNGIDESVLNNIFEAGYTTKSTGNGLGLPIVKELVQKYHGDVLVESEKGKGTCVSLRLNLVVDKPYSKIVLCEDSDNIAELWRLAGQAKGIDVTTYRDPDNLINELSLYDNATRFYVDFDLGTTTDGLAVTKVLFQKGYQNLYITTGRDPAEFSHITWIKGVIGKKPSFLEG